MPALHNSIDLVNAKHEKSAFDLMEEAVHLLRLSSLSVIGLYYIGSLPFVLALLYFWADMSRNALAQNYCSAASLGLTLLFVWMKCWQAEFSLQVLNQSGFKTSFPRSGIHIAHRALIQAILHLGGLFALPMSLILTFPFGWCFAFYQSLSAQDYDIGQDMKSIVKTTWHQATLWQKQNHILLFILSLFALVVFLNLTIAVYGLPHLLKSFFGIETIFTLSGFSVLNTTFLAVVAGLTYLCVDPLIKTVYALRCFYGRSLKTGEDLKSALNQLREMSVVIGTVTVLSGLTVSCSSVIHPSASFLTPQEGKTELVTLPPKNDGTASLMAEQLDHSIEEVLKRREFNWRMPPQKTPDTEMNLPGPLQSLVDWIKETWKGIRKTIRDWIKAFEQWMKKIVPEIKPREKTERMSWMDKVNELLNMLLAILLIVLLILLWKIWRKRRKIAGAEAEAQASVTVSMPDIGDEQVTADNVPADQWLKLAKELMDNGMLRLALRALFLATLASLADNGVITIARYKSNRDYERELKRRSHEKPEILSLFSGLAALFDKAWYGAYEVSAEDVHQAALSRDQMTAMLDLR